MQLYSRSLIVFLLIAALAIFTNIVATLNGISPFGTP
jgi:hypothetical protein